MRGRVTIGVVDCRGCVLEARLELKVGTSLQERCLVCRGRRLLSLVIVLRRRLVLNSLTGVQLCVLLRKMLKRALALHAQVQIFLHQGIP